MKPHYYGYVWFRKVLKNEKKMEIKIILSYLIHYKKIRIYQKNNETTLSQKSKKLLI